MMNFSQLQDTDDEGPADGEVAGEMWTPLDRPPPPLASGMQPLVTGELRGMCSWQEFVPLQSYLTALILTA